MINGNGSIGVHVSLNQLKKKNVSSNRYIRIHDLTFSYSRFPRFFMPTCANSLNIFCYSAVFFFFFENLRSFSTRKKCENSNVFHCSIPLFHETAQVFLDYPIESNGISNSVLRFLTDTFVNICAHGFMHSYLDNS